jgi:hypothetical protein
MLAKAIETLDSIGYPVLHRINLVEVEKRYLFGFVFENKLYLTQNAFVGGQEKLEEVLFEESEYHLKLSFLDMTRSGQTWLIEQLLEAKRKLLRAKK